jgi:flagellar assembly factor FliW
LLSGSPVEQILTRQFGALEFEAAAVLEFPAGLPGFEDQTRFVLVEQPATAPVVFLQSLLSPELCFLAAPMVAVDPGYDLAVTPEDLRLIELDDQRQPRPGDEVVCLALLSAAEDGPLTANLLAPVVVNVRTRRAIQAVRVDSRYSHVHPLATRGASCS